MRDDLSAPNLGQAKREAYDAPFFWQSYRTIEQWMARLLSKGPINVSTLTADDVTADTVTGTAVNGTTITGTTVSATDATLTGKLRLTSALQNDTVAQDVSPLRIGLTTGYNVFFDNQDIQARNNGAVTTLYLNWMGGTVELGGTLMPSANGTLNLGSSAMRWNTVYTSDLSLSNGIGDWTIVEGEDDLFLYNNRKGKTYKFTLTEVDPASVPPKVS